MVCRYQGRLGRPASGDEGGFSLAQGKIEFGQVSRGSGLKDLHVAGGIGEAGCGSVGGGKVEGIHIGFRGLFLASRRYSEISRA